MFPYSLNYTEHLYNYLHSLNSYFQNFICLILLLLSDKPKKIGVVLTSKCLLIFFSNIF